MAEDLPEDGGGLVACVIEDARWEGLGLPALAESAAAAVLARLGMDPEDYEIVVMGCDDARIAALNADFRGKPQPTNVLSWPSEERGPEAEGAAPDLPAPGEDEPESLGDIALAWETCAAEAEAAGKPMAEHVTHLVVHGILHLLGYDHIRDGDATLMETLEVGILASMGVADPYS